MSISAFIFLGLLFASVLIALEVSGGELAETEQIDETNGVETKQDYTWGGGYGGGHGRGGFGGQYGGGGYRGGYGGGRCGGYGCCGWGGYGGCRCCASAAEAEAYAAAQAKNKP